MATVQVRVDDDVKREATAIYDELGIDLSTAIRMFLKRSIAVRGVPFGMQIDGVANKGIQAMRQASEISRQNGNSEMTLDEINAEIAAARAELRARK